MFRILGTFVALPALVVAQLYPAPNNPPPATTAAAAVSVPSAPASTSNQINIDVAFNGNFVFNPANVSANPGTLLNSLDRTLAHSVTQSSFANPCTYLTASGSDPAGFDSGLVLASQFTINVTDNQPIYFHCKQVTHCGLGMVGTINAPSTGNTFDAFMSAAVSLGGNQPTDDPNAVATGGVHGVATATPSSDAGGGSSGGTSSSATKVVASGFAALSVIIAMMIAVLGLTSKTSPDLSFFLWVPTLYDFDMFTKSAILFALPAFVAAQYGYAPPSNSGPTSAASAAATVPSAPPSSGNQVNIDVAFNGNFVFNPANVTASPGTLVTFYFPGGTTAHSVTQSSFQNPCTYLAANGSNSAGFDSGLVTASTFTINVTDTSPIWFHCKQITHCGSGMVGSINAPSTGNTFDVFQSAAKSLGSNAPTDDATAVATGGLHAIATATPSSDAGTTGGSGGSSSPSSATQVVASGFALLSVIIGMMMV
ncbi:hypothetical protein CVT25_006504 [Psilocybe cyanescens]|uniref:Blue (type 1) copper domain-containing protein n=1 Tax=Psilocybe cyanescens TaxID=93625 RepID=A0A409XEC8_PSICY|nr:hypothetical protein CVT25_006504 [Psilocybe cyanescens]